MKKILLVLVLTLSTLSISAQDSVSINLPDVGDIYMKFDTNFVKIAKASNFTIYYEWDVLSEMDVTFFIYYKQNGYQIVRLNSNSDVNGYRMYDDSITTEPIEPVIIPNGRSYVSLTYNRTYQLWIRSHPYTDTDQLYNFTKFINKSNSKL